jgi:hypothetical protein
VDGFSTAVVLDRPGWPAALRVVIYRKRVFHESRKNVSVQRTAS